MVGNQPTRLVCDEDADSFWGKYPVLETFMHAADAFVKHVGGTFQIWAASRDWFLEEWGRDTFISFPGILLVTRRFGEAREIVGNFAAFEKNGLIPNRVQENKIEYNSADAPM
jgi:predicted glycogen debranching enzyme